MCHFRTFVELISQMRFDQRFLLDEQAMLPKATVALRPKAVGGQTSRK